MTKDELVSLCPVLFHMSEVGSWDSIRRHGLQSTTALLDLFEISGSERFDIKSKWRPESRIIEHSVYGKAVIRDQKVMPENDLQKCLDGLTTRQWYELLNHKTFFWVDWQRLKWMLGAREYRHRAHWVIMVDTRALLDRHAENVTLSSQNSGSILDGRRRGWHTFQTMGNYAMRWVAELAVEYSVSDIGELTICVEEWKRDRRPGVIWKP